MLPEDKYKKYLIQKLNIINSGWVDGDEENILDKTSDLTNHKLKISIEIKDDEKYQYKPPPLTGEMITETINLLAKNKQFKDDAQDANRKFRNYPNYKTVLLIRTELINIPFSVIGYIFSGIRRFIKPDKKLMEIGRINQYFSQSSTKEIGGYLLFGNNKYYYFKNPNAERNRVISISELEDLFGEKIENLQSYITQKSKN